MDSFIDISAPISPALAAYPGNPPVQFEAIRKAGAGETALTRIVLGSHTGTHMDAPSHVFARAAGTATYALEQLNGPVQIVAIQAVDIIGAKDLPATTRERVLIKTRNSSQDSNVFDETFVALDESAAQELVRRGIKLIGIDGPSIKKRSVKDHVHEILLEAGIAILEGLRLASVAAGRYELLCLPLPVDLDGAPVRAVLRR